MVSNVAQLVVEVALLKQNAAQHPGVYQYLQGAVYCGPPDVWREMLAQLLGGEVPVPFADGAGQRPARRGGAEPTLVQGFEYLVCRCCSPFRQCHCRQPTSY